MPVKCETTETSLMQSRTATLPVERRKTANPDVKPDVKKDARKRVAVHISGTTVPDCSCELVGIDAGVLYVRSERQISESSPVTVSFDHVQLSGVIASCKPADKDWAISVALGSCKRRLEDRVSTGEKSVIGVVDGEGTTILDGEVIDTSSSGLGLRLARPIDPGARVCVETQSMMVFGEVRHCRKSLDGSYIAGVLVVEVVPDLRSQSAFSVMLYNLRWRLASTILGKDAPAYRADQ